MTANSVDGTREPSNLNANGGVKTHQEEMASQQDNSWSAIQEQEYLAASSNTASSPTAAKKKKSRTGYWKEKKAARKLAQAAADGEMNDHGGVSTSPNVEKASTQLDSENIDPNANNGQGSEVPAPEALNKLNTKPKKGKKSKGSPLTTPPQDMWPSAPNQNEGSGDDGWGDNTTHAGWDYYGGDEPLPEEVNPKRARAKKKAVKAKVAGEPATEIDASGLLSSRAGNAGTPADRANLVEDGTTSTAQPKVPKKAVKKKKVKADKHAAQEQEQETPNTHDGAQGGETTGNETQLPTSTAADATNGRTDGPPPAGPNGILRSLKEVFSSANGSADTPTPDSSNSKDSKPKQMKIQMDLDVELASVLKAKVKGEMMITFM
ncbi:hypothetical protein MGYG_05712 [Nannizzia gypsea CBS 118893]|uniref:Uncharacterized protein n=1 Tax=Arthroderma gypseum (strain ATCC MYA-4604 / CBS 118893) TaxID=535722 RepID=E4UXI0_ARTGP|nr:hypothetical protein MGYG_05712 [Nannizzia gypsea CBS 118893]EFR02714.1 hypothetical protein MGYG_05712 [Nannizzia gypsea CBS 118893]